MDREVFDQRKQALIALVNANLHSASSAKKVETELLKLLALLHQYTFANRLVQKGLLSHTITDSMELDNSIGERFLEFDDDIK